MEKINAAYKQQTWRIRVNFHDVETVMFHAPGRKNAHLI